MCFDRGDLKPNTASAYFKYLVNYVKASETVEAFYHPFPPGLMKESIKSIWHKENVTPHFNGKVEFHKPQSIVNEQPWVDFNFAPSLLLCKW